MDENNESWSTVTPTQVAEQLWQRFEGDTTQILDFVEQTRQAVQNKTNASSSVATTTGSDTAAAAGGETANNDSDLGPALLAKHTVVSCLAPRGKVALHWHTTGLRAVDIKTSMESWCLTLDHVLQGVVFPKPEDCKKDLSKRSSKSSTNDMVVLHLSQPISVRGQKKTVAQVTFPLPTEGPVWQETNPSPRSVKTDSHDNYDEDQTKAWLQVLQTIWPKAVFSRVYHPQRKATMPSSMPPFSSYSAHGVSTTSAGMPFVTCYHGTSDGVLYPLEDGSLLFYKPTLLIPSSQINGITTGGRGSNGGGRYMDLIVQCMNSNDQTLEFTNLNSDEMDGLQKFLLLAGSVPTTGNDPPVDQEQEGEGAHEDTDTPTNDHGRHRSKRKASVEARSINKRIVVAVPEAEGDDNDDSEDDIEYQVGTADDDDDDDSESDEDAEDDEDDDGTEEEEEAVYAQEVMDVDVTEDDDTESEG